MKKFSLLLFSVLLCISNYSLAQLVNTENSRKEKKEGIQGMASVGFMFNKTTNEIIHIQNDIGIQYSKKQHTFLLLNNLELMKVSSSTGNQDLINQHFQHFRYNYSRNDSSLIIWEYFAQHQQNKLKYQDLRIVSGAGPRFRIVEKDVFSFFICPLFMYEHEKEFETQSSKASTSVLKGDFYGVLTLKLSDGLSIKHVTYYQPAFIDLSKSSNFEPINDFRIASETALTFKLFKKMLEFSTVFTYSHDSRPPGLFVSETGDNKMNFYAIKNEIKLKF
ncbi:MAG TPA: DUF481 domain-containing protein [Tenuifilaceae bacterium]|nr:DUF481 domain-containing protein [Tenuifilaceae bacterium]